MHHDIPLLTNISIAIVMAFAGGFLARRLGLPTIVGYLLAGMAIGPFTPGFVGDVDTIGQLAELGVIFLMFGVGLHFSLRDLWSVRRVAIPGALLQITLATGLGFALVRLWGWSIPAGLVFGLAISIASTVVLLRGLMDNALLDTSHGRVAVGWLVLEDLATVLILVLLPAIFGKGNEAPLRQAAEALLTAAAFVGVMLYVGARVMPWLLTRIAFTRSRELFILAVVAVAIGTALGSAALFGVSLALGAFLAGVVLGESSVHHQIGAEILPFRELFAVIFFVSVGMLVNPAYLLAHVGQVLAVTALIVAGKIFLTILIGFLLPCPGRTALVVAAGLSQIGEFSFIVGQAGVSLDVLTQEQYSLILAGALLSIMLNPLMFRLLPWGERMLRGRMPAVWKVLNRHGPAFVPVDAGFSGHVVVVGCGRVGGHVLSVLERLSIPTLVVEVDAGRAAELQKRGVAMLFGDAANSEILKHADLKRASALVVTVPDEAAAEVTVATAREMAPELPIVARAATRTGIERLMHLGATDVIHPELEGGLEVMRHTLLTLGYPAVQVQQFTDAVRRDNYNPAIRPKEYHLLEQLVDAIRGIEIAWRAVDAASPLPGRTLADANLRATMGVSVIALVRQGEVNMNPDSRTPLRAGDILGLIGEKDQIAATEALLAPKNGGNHSPDQQRRPI